MTAYYNENDPFAAAWLRNLIAEGLIADGQVDARSIADVRPADLDGFGQCHFFAGIGGWSLALRRAGWPDDLPVWTGSCPCQPFSLAGKQQGFDDARHLWPVWRNLIEECRPATVFGEQVASAAAWLGLVRGDLEAMGYAVGAMPVQAASAGADHLRDRYWFVADATSEGSFPGAYARIHCQQEGTGPRDGEPERRGSANLADADGAGSQGRGLLPERAGEQFAGPDGVADANQFGTGEGRQQRSGQQRGTGGDTPPCDGGVLQHAAGFAQREPDDEGDAIADGGQARPVSGGSGDHLEWVIGADGKARRVEPGICLLAHGVPGRVGKLRGFGNAIDPRPAEAFIRAFVESTHDRP